MNEPISIDAEFDAIEAIFKKRDQNADRLPGKAVRFIPEERADAVLELDKRMQKLKKILPLVVLGLVVVLAFAIGRAL